MALKTKAALDALVTMVAGIPGVQKVYSGVPESFDHIFSAYVAMGGQPLITDKATQLVQRETQFLVVFAHKVKGNETPAENTIADALDVFVTQFLYDRANGVGLFARDITDVLSGDLDVTLAATPEYQISAGQEVRRYPLLVSATQRDCY
jgi:hypothetical protein